MDEPNNLTWPYKDFGNFNVSGYRNRKKVEFTLGVEDYDDYRQMPYEVEVDALEVYKALKDYFKGSEYE